MNARIVRILSGIVLPAPIGVLAYYVIYDISFIFSEFLEACMAAYFFIGIQSILYSLTMEFFVHKYCHSFIAILLSSFLGAVTGLSVEMILSNGSILNLTLDMILYSIANKSFIHIGIIIGFIVGILLRIAHLKYPMEKQYL